MPRVTAEQVQQAFKMFPKQTTHQMGEALREFGYTSVTDEWVEAEVNRLLESEEYRKGYHGGPSMFLRDWLEKGMD